jgi:hypothetical protein
MENPRINVEVKHSESKTAFNVVGTDVGKKYKIARVPYLQISTNKTLNERAKKEARKHAEFIAFCFNNSDKIIQNAFVNF